MKKINQNKDFEEQSLSSKSKDEFLNPKRALIIQIGSKSELIFVTPMLIAFKNKFPKCSLNILVNSDAVDIIKEHQALDTILIIKYKKNKIYSLIDLRHIIKFIKKQNYDLILSPNDKKTSAIITYFSKVKYSFGVSNKFYYKYSYDFENNLNEILKRLSFLKKVLSEDIFYKSKYDLKDNLTLTETKPILYSPAKSSEKINELFFELNIKKPIIIAPTTKSPTKNWPIGSYTLLVQKLIIKYRKPVLLIAENKDDININNILYLTKMLQKIEIYEQIFNIAGKLNLIEIFALFKMSSLLICNDSAIQYLALTAELPFVSIFGPTLPKSITQDKHSYSTAEIELACRPCNSKDFYTCPELHFKCMKNITPEIILNKISKLKIN